MLQSLWECNRRNVGPGILFPAFLFFFRPFLFLTLRKLPTSPMRLPLRLPGDGFPSTPSRGVLHAFQPDFQVCVNGLRHGGFWSLLCLVISSRTRRRAAILRHSRGQNRAPFPAAPRKRPHCHLSRPPHPYREGRHDSARSLGH